MQADSTEEHDRKVRDYIGRMLSSRKGRRKLAKKDGAIKYWKENQHVYGPVNKPIDLGIKKFKKMAREKLDKPYKTVLNYKIEMHKAFRKATRGEL